MANDNLIDLIEKSSNSTECSRNPKFREASKAIGPYMDKFEKKYMEASKSPKAITDFILKLITDKEICVFANNMKPMVNDVKDESDCKVTVDFIHNLIKATEEYCKDVK